MNETMKQWVKKSGKKCEECHQAMTNIETAYCENLHTAQYFCVNCLARHYYLHPKIKV